MNEQNLSLKCYINFRKHKLKQILKSFFFCLFVCFFGFLVLFCLLLFYVFLFVGERWVMISLEEALRTTGEGQAGAQTVEHFPTMGKTPSSTPALQERGKEEEEGHQTGEMAP